MKCFQALVKTRLFGYSNQSLTIRAVLPAPSLQAVTVPLRITGVVSKGVVPGPAVGGTGLAVVVLVANHTVGVTQLALVPVLGPSLSDCQPALRRQAADEVVLVLWVNEVRISGENLIVFVRLLDLQVSVSVFDTEI